ncbi:tyrosyl-DNA phosphodiesterase-domain-containing protein [Staphylotrichum tortipilum]|uniref:Tyrosyl-DNA phosphodiesterase-domain-containing protein n=1 Tax=Staphylotrichum tortipilum TaxID=2831512 RepID=A0AAN6MKT8_9PEZI|nr:tyrosyl-DNA phosphodiesterase-domain-containing protein [Staphylotrichum longicolle]
MAERLAAEINGEEDEDEALRIAIAMSLGQVPGTTRKGVRDEPGGVIDLTGEHDDESGGGGGGGGGLAKASVPAPEKLAPPVSSSGLSAFGLDRKQMEAERLARLSKRKASQLENQPTAQDRPAQRARVSATPPPPAKTSSATGQQSSSTTASSTSSSTTTPPPRRLPFPHGVVKRTWAFGQPRHADDIRLEDVLQKARLELAVLSSFQWDEGWLLTKIDLARTKVVLVAFAVDEAQREEMRANVPRDRIRFCFPPMQSMGYMHSKLQLLKYEGYLRIVVPTGNLMSYDWGETGTIENMVFIIDLPKFRTAEERDAQKPTPFAEELLYFLRAQTLDEKLVTSLLNYDFLETARYRFVHTIPGTHADQAAWKRTGYCGLGQAVNSLGFGTSAPIELDFICSSLGAVNYGFAWALYSACQGDSGLKEYESRTPSSKSKANTPPPVEVLSTLNHHMRVFFPSRETVLQSTGGVNSAGTICFLPKWWQAATFPRTLLRDAKSTRPGLLIHSKVLYARGDKGAFAYVGSANMSESAWGRLVKDRGTGKPRITCRNWECGVLIPADGTSPAGSDGDGDGLGAFVGSVPVPMEWASRSISAAEGAASAAARTPWFNQGG